MCYMMIAVAAISAYSAYSNAKTQKDQAQYQQQVAENNAKVADWQATDAIQRGNVAAQNERRKGQQTIGSQRAAMAAAGLDVSTGSALSILEDTDYFNRYDQNTIKDNAAREAWGYKVQGSNARASAELYGNTAGNINPLFEGVKSGVGSYYSNGGSFGKSGVTGGTAVNPSWYKGNLNGSAGTTYIPPNLG